MNKLRSFCLIATLFCWGIAVMAGTATADWAKSFAVYDGNTYVSADVELDSGQLGGKLGEVTFYSDEEGTYSGNFSNRYAKGTEYYEITGVDPQEAIAIHEEGSRYIKAVFDGEYEGARVGWREWLPYAVGAAVVLAAVGLLYRYLRLSPSGR